MRLPLCAAAALLAVAAGSAFGQATKLDLSQYQLVRTANMPSLAFETSAITYNWNRDTFVVLDDEGFDIVEIDKWGQQLGAITVTGHPSVPGVNTQDTESITYLGNNKFMIGLERIRNAFIFETTFPAQKQTINLSDFSVLRLQLFGPNDNVGNSGLEGLSYNPTTNSYLGVKETSPMQIYSFTFDPATRAVSLTQPYSTSQIAALGMTDFSDIQSLGTVPSFGGTALSDNFLVLSHESAKLAEMDGSGSILGTLDLRTITAGWNLEGVTIDNSGNIYVVGEDATGGQPGRMFVFAPVPEPSSALLLVSGLGLLGGARRWRRAAAA